MHSTNALLYGSSFSSKGAFALPSIVLKIKTMWHPLTATTRQHTGRGKGVTRIFLYISNSLRLISILVSGHTGVL